MRIKKQNITTFINSNYSACNKSGKLLGVVLTSAKL